MTEDNFKDCVKVTLGIEGGYVDNPNDPGKATNLGITIGLLSQYEGKQATDEDVRNLTVGEALQIYRSVFWDKCQCDKMPKSIALVVFDAAVNSGPRRSIEWLQHALGVSVDGAIGPQTLGKLEEANLAEVVHEATADRLNFMMKCVDWEEFKNGWSARVDHICKLALSWIS
jgi:lysozyme family protein